MSDTPACSKCFCEYTYREGNLIVCPACGDEWAEGTENVSEDVVKDVVKDVNGNVLANGDTVVLIKDLKVKGSSNSIKQGTVVKNIFLVNEAGHNISCKIQGFGAMNLKSEFVKKA